MSCVRSCVNACWMKFANRVIGQNETPYMTKIFAHNHISCMADVLEALLCYHAFLQEEATVYEALGSVIKLAVAHRMIGEVYSSMGQYGKALKHQMKHLGMTLLVF